MIRNFHKVTDNLYRGGDLSPNDVVWLKNNLNIDKIITLDEKVAKRIDRTCKLLNINHIILPLDGTKQSLINLLKHNLKDLLGTGRVFVGCVWGKDRTGFLIALYQCLYLHKNPEDAIKEAKKLGFGVGVDPKFINIFERLIRKCKSKDINNADIVSNEREYRQDSKDAYLDETNQTSFAPFLGKNQQYPFTSVYRDINDQSPTRENYDEPIIQHDYEDIVPIVGLYNNDAGISGAGPTINVGGFIYD